MRKARRVISGSEWRAMELVFKIQKENIVPSHPWDVIATGGDPHCTYDQGVGGEWQIVRQEFTFEWNTDEPDKHITLSFSLRGEIPLANGGEQVASYRAQHRWFVEGVITKTTSEGSVQFSLIEDEQQEVCTEVCSANTMMKMLEAGFGL